jgi:hypothetical protein
MCFRQLSQVLGFDCTITRSLVLQRKYSMCFFHFCTPTQQFKMEHKNQKKLIVFSFLHDMKFCLFLHEASCISLPGGFYSCGFIKNLVSTWLCCKFNLFYFVQEKARRLCCKFYLCTNEILLVTLTYALRAHDKLF